MGTAVVVVGGGAAFVLALAWAPLAGACTVDKYPSVGALYNLQRQEVQDGVG